MATRFGNVKGIKFLEEPLGANRGGIALVSFDMVGGVAYTGGADTAQLGGGGFENGTATTLTLAQMIQNRRRDGRTVVLDAAMAGPAPGAQAAATNGPLVNVQTPAVSASNVTLNLFNAATGGAAVTTTTASWDRAATVMVQYTASFPAFNPE